MVTLIVNDFDKTEVIITGRLSNITKQLFLDF